MNTERGQNPRPVFYKVRATSYRNTNISFLQNLLHPSFKKLYYERKHIYVNKINYYFLLYILVTEVTPTSSPCSPSPCGPNGECREHNGAGACVCSEGYEGDPYSPQGCRRECENNDDCSPNLSCIRFKCIDPCPRTCGQMAQCIVENHVPICTCPKGYSGDPFFECKQIILPRKNQDILHILRKFTFS